MARRVRLPVLAGLLLSSLAAGGASAADAMPEIRRAVATAQAVGVVHTLRTIPEACARLQGRFTGEPAAPYRFEAVRTGERCQPRAKLLDAAKVRPDAAQGWILNDLIRVPSADCPGRQAELRIWRHPADAVPPGLDAQGRARIYLEQSLQQAQSGQLAPVPLYAAALTVEGAACR